MKEKEPLTCTHEQAIVLPVTAFRLNILAFDFGAFWMVFIEVDGPVKIWR
jgi:hypothetical protein